MVIGALGYQPKLSPYVLAYTTLSTLRISPRNSSIIHIKQTLIHQILSKIYQYNHKSHIQSFSA